MPGSPVHTTVHPSVNALTIMPTYSSNVTHMHANTWKVELHKKIIIRQSSSLQNNYAKMMTTITIIQLKTKQSLQDSNTKITITKTIFIITIKIIQRYTTRNNASIGKKGLKQIICSKTINFKTVYI